MNLKTSSAAGNAVNLVGQPQNSTSNAGMPHVL